MVLPEDDVGPTSPGDVSDDNEIDGPNAGSGPQGTAEVPSGHEDIPLYNREEEEDQDSQNASGGYWSMNEDIRRNHLYPSRIFQPTESDADLSYQDECQVPAPELYDIRHKSGTRSDPFYPQYNTPMSRQSSFPGNEILLNGFLLQARHLANAGFFFKNVNGHHSVQCFHCGGSVRIWQEGMDPVMEHCMLSPNCRAINKRCE